MRLLPVFAVFALLPAAAPAPVTDRSGMVAADSARSTCADRPTAPPSELAGWAARTPAAAAPDEAGIGGSKLVVGEGRDVALLPTPTIHYPLRPSHPGGSVSFGGLLAVDVATAGTYRVAIGSAAWIDIIRDGRTLESTAHGHGPACSGIVKMVDFTLTPGRHVVEIAGNGTPSLSMLIARLP